MRKLTFGMNVSLDGYIAAPGDDLGWSVPGDELFQWWSDRLGATSLSANRPDELRCLRSPLPPRHDLSKRRLPAVKTGVSGRSRRSGG